MSTTSRRQTAAQSQLPTLLETLSSQRDEFEAAVVSGSDNDVIIEIAEGLWAIVEEAIDVLETIDFEGLPDAIDVHALLEAIEVDRLADTIETGDATDAIDLTALYEAIDLWKLWAAVDVPALRKEQLELQEEISSFLGGDEETGERLFDLDETATALLGAETRQRAIQQRLDDSIDAFRTALLETHARVRRLFEANRRKHGTLDSRSSTAVATMPRGPSSDSAATRASTVLTRVRHSHTTPRPRIYGRRFERTMRR